MRGTDPAMGEVKPNRRGLAAVVGFLSVVVLVGAFGPKWRGRETARDLGCGTTSSSASLPAWASGSGLPAGPRVVVGERGLAVAAPFVQTLSSHPLTNRKNKVLILTKSVAQDGLLRIEASLDPARFSSVRHGNTDDSFPGYLDVPSPGCWRIDLSWSGGSDTMFLRYD